MWLRFALLIFCFFAIVRCESENADARRRLEEKKGNSGSSDRGEPENVKSHSSNTWESERSAGSVPESPELHGGGNRYDSNTNNRQTGAGQSFGGAPAVGSSQFSNNQRGVRYPSGESGSGRPYGESESGQQIQSRPSNQGGFSSGRPIHESTNYGQETGSRPAQGGNNFSGRPAEESSSPSGGFEAGNKGRPGRPSGGSTFGQSSGRPSGSSTFGQSSELRPGNEGRPGRPSGSSTFGQSGTLRPGEGSGQLGSGTQRPDPNKETEHLHAGNKPQGEQSQGTEGGKEDDKDVCFTHLGCFKMGKPWKSTLRPVGAPHPPEKIQTVVHFYSRQNPKEQQNITVYPQVNMGRARFDPQKISAMIVHGFSNSGNATWMKEMKDVYLRKVDANVMIVDWGKGAQLLNYLQVAGNTRVVGKQLGSFVKYLIEQYGADPGRFHLIGHSLGAQICSYLAKDVPGIARLTALDPAQPGFEGFSKEVRLDQTDAEFVDVIHTDARPFIPTLGFGMIAPHGHVDFYMNGGFDQPGCVPPAKKDLPVIKSFLDFAKFPVETIAKIVACPHARAYEYLIEAFNETDNCIFWGHKTDVKNVFKTVTNTVTQGLFKKFTALSTTCSKDDCIPLGFATKKSPLRGAFVVTTSGRSPYCISEPGVPPETLPQDRQKKSFVEKIKEAPILG